VTGGAGLLLAVLPIALILGLMLGVRWPASRAGLAGLAVALVVAWTAFGYGTAILTDLGPALAALGALLEASFVTVTILWIIFPALCIHELQVRTGGVATLRDALARLSDDPRVIALLIAWFFALFMEGAAGFGTSVALAAPFLVSAGFGRVQAVVIALIGHSVGVSFGAVGTPVLPQVAVTSLGALEIARATAVYHALVGWVMPAIVMALVVRSGLGGNAGARPWLWTALAAGFFLVPFTFLAWFVGPELPTLGGALFGGLAFVGVLAATNRRASRAAAAAKGRGSLLRAASPYLALVTLVLLTRLVPPLQEVLRSVVLEWRLLEAFGGSMQVLYHPGTMLLLAFAIAAWWQRAPRADVGGAMRSAFGQLLPVTVALVAMLGLSRVMVYSGMIAHLADAAAALAGGSWPLLAPAVGMLGTFVTGSATASNILFTEFQQATALRLELAVLPLVAAQGFGAAVGNIICPHNIIAAGATVRLAGEEGEVLRQTLWVALLYAGLGGLLAYFVFVPS
jgi:lactate permease